MVRRAAVMALVAAVVVAGAAGASVRGGVLQLRGAGEGAAATGDLHELSRMVDEASRNAGELEKRAGSGSGSAPTSNPSTDQLRAVLEAHIKSVQQELAQTDGFVPSEPAEDVAERLARATHEFIRLHLVRHAVNKAQNAEDAAEDAKSMAEAAIARSPNNPHVVQEEEEVIKEADAAISAAEKVKSQSHVQEALAVDDDELVAHLKQVGDGLRRATTSGGNLGSAPASSGGQGECGAVPQACVLSALKQMQSSGDLKKLLPDVYDSLGLGQVSSQLHREAMREERLAEIKMEAEQRSRAVQAAREKAHEQLAERAAERERELVAEAVSTAVQRARKETEVEARKMALEEKMEARKSAAEARVQRDMERKAMQELRHKAEELETAKQAAVEAEVAKSRAELQAEAEAEERSQDGSSAHMHADRAIALATQANESASKAVELAGGREKVLSKASRATDMAGQASDLAKAVKAAVPNGSATA